MKLMYALQLQDRQTLNGMTTNSSSLDSVVDFNFTVRW